MLFGIISWSYVLELVIACSCGFFIGLERTMRMKSAGVRTHCLLAAGACLLTILSKNCFVTEAHAADPARIAAQIIASVGFLGAGVIFREGDVLKGLSTAAGLWATAAVGMSIGADEIGLGLVLTVIILIVQYVFHFFPLGFDAYSENEIVITVEQDPVVEGEIRKIIKENNVKIKGRTLSKEGGVIVEEYRLVYKYNTDIKPQVEALIDYPTVRSVLIK